MSQCQRYMEWISAGLDGELSPDEEVLLREHLALCPHCAALLSDFSLLRESGDELLLSPPPELTEAIMAQVRAPSVKKSGGRVLLFRRSGIAAAVLALVLVGAGVMGRLSPAADPAGGVLPPRAGQVESFSLARTAGEPEKKAEQIEEMPVETMLTLTADEADTASAGEQQEALDLVVEHILAQEDCTAAFLPGPACTLSFPAGEGDSVAYTGLSPDGGYYCFSRTGEGKDPVTYAVPLDLSAVLPGHLFEEN